MKKRRFTVTRRDRETDTWEAEQINLTPNFVVLVKFDPYEARYWAIDTVFTIRDEELT